ncbi:hypothetical protein E3U55_16320 [Filobacillus milosensis]|uniref:Copper resistance protein CopD n=1 Tax=Filobacillus milosensis TaxID=94137 RepID=A0A4Y8IE69_9BACI|nr:hypothetical protein [Filobacillus milosensis]TFB13295.1 hypothetical protein E3U55_16320 [Filobacillus milosensis]
MTILVSLTEFILYTCFGIIFGSLILFLVPEDKRPQIIISKKVLFLAALFIPLAALVPVLNTADILNGDQNYWFIFKNILFTFEVGKNWILIALLSLALLRVIFAKNLKTNKILIYIALFITLFMLLGYTKSSHAASITEWQGFLYHTMHFLAVSIWIGILLVVSWFSKNYNNWAAFLKWFTPVAVTCLVVAVIAGYFTMQIDINSYDDPNASVLQEYQNGLIVNYGQALLLKHIFIISLVIFAVLNGILFRKNLNQTSFNPLKWARIESVYALIVFGLTAFMGQSWPPHQIYSLVKTYGASPMFTTLYDGNIVAAIHDSDTLKMFNVSFRFGLESYLLFGLGFIFMVITILASTKKHSTFVSSLSALLMVVALYFGIMFGIQ